MATELFMADLMKFLSYHIFIKYPTRATDFLNFAMNKNCCSPVSYWRQSRGWVINPPIVASTEWYLTVYVSLILGICHLRKKFQCLGGLARRGEGGGGSRMQLEKRKDRKQKLNLAPEKRSNFPPRECQSPLPHFSAK